MAPQALINPLSVPLVRKREIEQEAQKNCYQS